MNLKSQLPNLDLYSRSRQLYSGKLKDAYDDSARSKCLSSSTLQYP